MLEHCGKTLQRNLAHKLRNEPERMRSTFQGLARILRQLCDEGPEQVLFSRQVFAPGEGEGGKVALNFEMLAMWIKDQPAHLLRCYLNIQIRSPKLSACVSKFYHHGHTRGVAILFLLYSWTL